MEALGNCPVCPPLNPARGTSDTTKHFNSTRIIVNRLCWTSAQSDQHLRGPRIARQQLSTDICCSRPTLAANPPTAVLLLKGETDGRTDTRPLYDAYRILCCRYVGPAKPRYCNEDCLSCLLNKRRLLSSVVVDLFLEWASCCKINSTHLNSVLDTYRPRHCNSCINLYCRTRLPLPARHGSAVGLPCTVARELCRVADMDCRRRLRSASTLQLHVPPTSASATAQPQSPQLLASATLCRLTSSRRHRSSPSNDGSTHCSSAARFISDSLTPDPILHDTVVGFILFFCC